MVKIRRPQFDSPSAAATTAGTNTNGSTETLVVNGTTSTTTPSTSTAPAQRVDGNDTTTAMELDDTTTPQPVSAATGVLSKESSSSSSMEVDGIHQPSEAVPAISEQPKLGPRPISMNAYQQLQQQRLQDRKSAPPISHGSLTPLNPIVQQFQVPSILDPSSTSSPAEKAKAEESADALAHLQQLVSKIPALATQPPVPASGPTLAQQQASASSSSGTVAKGTAALPGPDLTRIIFAGVATTTNPTGGPSASTTTPSNGSSLHPKIPNGGSANHGSHHHKASSFPSASHRRSMTGSSGGVSSSVSSQPTSTSQSSTSSSSASANPRQQPPHKTPRAIHAIELIRIAGEILQLPPTTIGTALIYYHKYRAYLHQAMRRGDKDNEAFKADEYLFATACLHLACKCTEVSRKVRDLVNVTYRVMNPNQPVLSLSTKPGAEEAAAAAAVEQAANASQAGTGAGAEGAGDGSQTQSQPAPPHTFPVFPNAPPPTVTTYWHIRDSLLTTELMLLRILQFDLDVPLPFNDILRTFKGMGSVFEPSEEEAAHLYPHASSFDVFLPNLIKGQHHHRHDRNQSPKGLQPPGASNSPSGGGSNSMASTTLSSSSPSSSSPHVGGSLVSGSGGSLEPHQGVHPALSAMVQMAMTFCIDALCSSAIALHCSSRAMALGATYLAIRAVGLELPMPFEEWCYAWGRPSVLQAFGVDHHPHLHHHVPLSNGRGGSMMINGGSGAGSPRTGTSTGVTMMMPGSDGDMTASSGTGTNAKSGSSSSNSATTTTTTTTSAGVGGAGSAGGGGGGGASHLSSTTLFAPLPPGMLKRSSAHVPVTGEGSGSSKTGSPLFSGDPQQAHTPGSSPRQPPAPMTIVEEVQRVVQELASFYTH
ncbi:hypothetical protein DFQ26_002256 [Actinomortierella ambigua]|nr:hypothetical protein DFQ26_002256 [Actinomortierella ambigua]